MKSFVPHGLAKQNIASGFPIHSNWSSRECDAFIRNLLPGPFAYLEHLEDSGSAILTFESRINDGSEPSATSQFLQFVIVLTQPFIAISHNLSWLPCIWDRSSLSTYLDEPTGHGLQFCKGNATAVWRNAGIFIGLSSQTVLSEQKLTRAILFQSLGSFCRTRSKSRTTSSGTTITSSPLESERSYRCQCQ